jgi:hypothetical protein
MNGTRRPLTFHLSEAHSFWCFEGPSVFTGLQDFGMLAFIVLDDIKVWKQNKDKNQLCIWNEFWTPTMT